MRIAVGISGGVDSAVAALLLKRQGHELIGVTMTLGRANEAKSLAEAEAVAGRLGIPFKVFDWSNKWDAQVIRYLKAIYLKGWTPNPCVRCNEMVKFSLLPEAAFALGCDAFATGHYARTQDGRLYRAVDRAKDQSYFLYRVRPEILKRTLFPLGELTKSEVRELARAEGFEAANREDSQDFCGGPISDFLGTDPKKGKIIRTDGTILGEHDGFWNYTIGKRKGLGIGGGTPYYVVELNAERNEVIVGFREETLVYDLSLRETVGIIDKSLPVKVRSAGEPKLLKDGLSGVAPGQSAVFYHGDELVGGGIIEAKTS